MPTTIGWLQPKIEEVPSGENATQPPCLIIEFIAFIPKKSFWKTFFGRIEIALRAKSNSEIEIREWEELIEKLNEYTYEGSSLIKENAIKFFKQQKLIKAANKIIKDGIAMLPDDAKGDFKAQASDIFIDEAINNACGALNDDPEKIALIKEYFHEFSC